MAQGTETSSVLSAALLLSVAEELKLPLTQIARRAELGGDATNFAAIQTSADTALKLLEHYGLGLRLSTADQPLMLEAVSVSSVLYDVSRQLDRLARQYGVELSMDIGGRYGPVTAHRAGLQAALVSLGMSLIEALPALAANQLKLQLATHRSRYGIVAGFYSETRQVSQGVLDRGRVLQGRSRQPFTGLTHTSGAGLCVADAILQSMQLRLTASRHHRLYGLATVLPSNPQLALV